MGVGLLVSDGASLSSYRSRYKALICDCYGFAAVFNLLFLFTSIFGKGAPRGLTMVPLGRELSIQDTLVCGTVWPQFAMQVLTGGRGGRMGSYRRRWSEPKNQP